MVYNYNTTISPVDDILFTKSGYNNTYGELTDKGLDTILKGIDTKNKNFIDLGSGCGSVVINACKNYPFHGCGGVELSKERHLIAYDRKKELSETLNPDVILKFVNKDIFDVDVNQGDVFYISNLCFNEEINKKLSKKLNREVQKGSVIISSREIPDLNYSRHEKINGVKQSWSNSSDVHRYLI